MTAPAVLLCGHGSRSPEAAGEFHRLREKIQQKMPEYKIFGAFLEHNAPPIKIALQDIYDQGTREIIVQPVTLYEGGHVRHDIPEILALFQQEYPDARLRFGASLGLNPLVIDAVVSAIYAVLPLGHPKDFSLLVVGRGGTDRAICDQSINLCRLLHDRLNFGAHRYCYSFGAKPLLTSALKQAGHSHYGQVIVVPFLLFSGRLLSDIGAETELAKTKYPAFSFHMTPPLGPQDAMVDALAEQIRKCGDPQWEAQI